MIREEGHKRSSRHLGLGDISCREAHRGPDRPLFEPVDGTEHDFEAQCAVEKSFVTSAVIDFARRDG